MTLQLTSAAVSRLELLIRRLFATTVLLASVETFAIATSQSPNFTIFGWLLVGLLALILLFIQYSVWIGERGKLPIFLYASFVIFTMLSWPFAIADPSILQTEYKPWIWWTVGMGVVAMGVAAKPISALLYLFLAAGLWFVVATSYYSGNSDPVVTLQDSLYVFLFGGTILGLFFLVRDAVLKVDQANTSAIQSAMKQASIDAVERERQRLDALVHDRVLNTLLLAAKAATPEDRAAARKSAADAIDSLKEAALDPEPSGTVTTLGLFRALRRAAIQLVPDIEVKVLTGGAEEVPSEVAKALTEAIIQGLDNVGRHAKAKNVELRLSALEPNGILIELKDDGVGFRLDRIPRDRIGVRTSIFQRLQSVNGRARIQTEPGYGTKLSLEWRG